MLMALPERINSDRGAAEVAREERWRRTDELYELFGSTGMYWSCHQCDWGKYLDLAIAFGWLPEGAFFKCAEGGYGEHPSASFTGNDFQVVTDSDARAMAVALNRAVSTINAGSPITDEQTAALKALEFEDREPILESLAAQIARRLPGCTPP
jgi:hypothetical protein